MTPSFHEASIPWSTRSRLRVPFGVEPLLNDVEALVQVGELLLAVILLEPEGRTCAALAQARVCPRLHQ
jgi:hypothetical protein